MKQSLALHVRGSPDHSNVHWTAIKLAHAWIDQGHNLHSVFFSGPAAMIAHGCRLVDTGSVTNLQQEWQRFGCDLVVCVNAARRCGILSELDAKNHQRSTDTLAPHFTIGGLGSLAEAKQVASKFIELVH